MHLLASWLLPSAAVLTASGLFTWLMMHMALAPWRKSIGQHWTERARLLWTARRTLIWVSLACASLGISFLTESRVALPPYVTIAVIVAGVMLGSFPSSSEIEPRYAFGVWLRQTLWQLVVQFGLLAIGVGLLTSMPQVMSSAAWWRTGFGLVAVGLILSGAWLPLVMRTKHSSADLTRMQQRLEEIAARATASTGVRPRYVWIGRTPMPNAFALPFINAVVFTSRCMEELDDEECLAIMLHEYEHLQESWGVRLTRLLGAMNLFSFIFVTPMMHKWDASGLLILVAVFLVINRATVMLRRRMEHRADDSAIGHVEHSAVYARALEKIYRAGQLPAVMPGKQMVHPNLYDRMLQAGVTPDYPRPAPPARVSWPGWLCLALTVAGYFHLFS